MFDYGYLSVCVCSKLQVLREARSGCGIPGCELSDVGAEKYMLSC